MKNSISIILPARNESASLRGLLPKLVNSCDDAEIIIVDDGSDDDTLDICKSNNVKVIRHPYPKGNGAAIKSGARAANGEVLVFMDADGQHTPENIGLLIDELNAGYDMVVASRVFKLNANIFRGIANAFYNKFASWITGHKIHDLTSGFRAVDANKFREFLFLLPNGFSYPTSITMAFFRSGYSVQYIHADIKSRTGSSHIKPMKDGLRFFLIIFKVGAFYSPLKVFFPFSLGFFITGVGYYIYTYITAERFTNMGILLFITSILIFLIGLISEQITTLLYSKTMK